jgi:hypothetical protein
MNDQDDRDFARRFVTAYWQDVKDHAEELPPGEPVEETVAELLARVSWEVQRDRKGLTIIMRDQLGDEWYFRFKKADDVWTITSFATDHMDDLLSPPYDRYFVPMLDRVMRSALSEPTL